ncbi:MAG: lysylphosphatidylglycerol synthase transmembrane domain-containing protein [Steroidobacteraceae bacterium]
MLKRSIKALIALVLLALLVRGVDWDQAQTTLERVSIPALAVTLVAMIWELVLSAWKWLWTLRMHGLEYRFGYLFQVLTKGYFINNFLPTAVGGDAYRAFRTMPSDGFKSRAVSAVLLDRVSGLMALLLWGAIAACWLWSESPVARWYLSLCFAGGAAALALLFIVYKGWLKALSNRVRHLAVFTAIEHNINYLKQARQEWVYVVVLSLAFQATSIGIVYWLFGRIDYPVAIAACALMAAAAGVAAVLPVSINGIGVMEGSLVGMAVALGVEYDAALVVAILRRLLMVALSVLCGAMFLIDREPQSNPRASAAS